MTEPWNHPSHYGGKDNPYEAIKVIEAWSLGFRLGNTVKYISRAEKKGATIEDLKKARWYLDREIATREAMAGLADEDARSKEETAFRNDPSHRLTQTVEEEVYDAYCETFFIDEPRLNFEDWQAAGRPQTHPDVKGTR